MDDDVFYDRKMFFTELSQSTGKHDVISCRNFYWTVICNTLTFVDLLLYIIIWYEKDFLVNVLGLILCYD